jgi:hypothetical protein
MAISRKKKRAAAKTTSTNEGIHEFDQAEEIEEVDERERPVLDRLTDLRMDITDDQSAVARLIDILIDANDGDSQTVLDELALERAGEQADSSGNSGNSADNLDVADVDVEPSSV